MTAGVAERVGAAARAPSIAWWKWALGPWMVGVIAGAFLYAGAAQGFQLPEAARIIFFHVPVAILLMVWFFVAAWHSGALLRRGNPRHDLLASAAAEVGLLCTILATISGAVFAKVQWGAWWNWDPKQVAIVVVMFIYFAYFALRAEIDDEERRARLSAAYAIVAGVAAPFLIYGVQYLPAFADATLHPKKTLLPGGMSSDYALVFWASLAGFFGITLWIYQLRVRLAETTRRLNEER